MLEKNYKLAIIFGVVFSILLAYYYWGKPQFILEDKNASDPKVSHTKSIGLALGISVAFVVVAQVMIKDKTMRLKMSCSCRD